MRNIFFPHYLSGEPFFSLESQSSTDTPIKFLLPHDVNVDCYVL